MQFSVELVALFGSLVIVIMWLAGLHFSNKSNRDTTLALKKDFQVKIEKMETDFKERVKGISDKYDDLVKKHEMLDTKVVEKLSIIERSLAKIEGKLGVD